MTKMAPGDFRNLTLISVSALGFALVLTFIGFIYEKFSQEENKESRDNEREYAETREQLLRSRQNKVTADPVPDNLEGELSSAEIVRLLGILERSEGSTLEELLVTLSNCCAFTRNQNLIRENGGLPKLIQLLNHHDGKIRTRAAQTLANLSINLENQKHVKGCILDVLVKLDMSLTMQISEEEAISLLHLLVNLSVVNTWHEHIITGISTILNITMLDPLESKLKTQSLRLLVNLSCNAENVGVLLEKQVLAGVQKFLTPLSSEENMLRAVTIVANITEFSHKNAQLQNLMKKQAKELKVKLASLEQSESEDIRSFARRASQYVY